MARCETPMIKGIGWNAHLHRIRPRCNQQRRRKRWCKGAPSEAAFDALWLTGDWHCPAYPEAVYDTGIAECGERYTCSYVVLTEVCS